MAFTYGYAMMAGIDFSRKTTRQEFPIGMIASDSKGRVWVYVKANATIGAFKLVKSAATADPYTNVLLATASNAGTKVVGMTAIALSAGDFAWIIKEGLVDDDAVLVSSAVANGDPIISDGTGQCTIAVETDINNIVGHVTIDDTDNTGSIMLLC